MIFFMIRRFDTFYIGFSGFQLNNNSTHKIILPPTNKLKPIRNTQLPLQDYLGSVVLEQPRISCQFKSEPNWTRICQFYNMSKGSVSVANIPHYTLQNLTQQTHSDQKQNFVSKVASMWNEYKKCMPVKGLLTGLFGLPPAKGDDTVWAVKFFMDAKEAY